MEHDDADVCLWRQPRAQHHCWQVVGLFYGFAMSMLGVVVQFLDVSLAHSQLVWTRHSACNSRDVGAGHVTKVKLLSSLRVSTSKCTPSHKELTHRASTDTRHDGCGTLCTATTTWGWEHRWTLSGTDWHSARDSS